MKRIALLVAAVASIGVVGAAPASADHHPACTSSPIVQTVKLTASAGTLNFSGSVLCKGATAGSITALTITPLVGAASAAPLTTSASCSPCTDVITAAGSIPAAAGVYEVKMDFTVTQTSNGRVFNTSRRGRYAFTEQGGVLKVCEHGWTLNCFA